MVTDQIGESELRVDYVTSVDDLVAFNQHVIKNAAALRRNRRAGWVFLAAIVLVILILEVVFVVLEAVTETPTSNWSWVLVFLVLWAALYAWQRSRRKHTLHAMCSEGRNRNVFTTTAVTIDESRLSVKTAFSQETLSWLGVEKIENTKNYILIYTSGFSGFVIPKRAFNSEADCDAFVDKAVAYHRAVDPGPCGRCGYDLAGCQSDVCPECGTPIPR